MEFYGRLFGIIERSKIFFPVIYCYVFLIIAPENFFLYDINNVLKWI